MTSTIDLHLATTADDADLLRLSQLDSARPVVRPALVAHVDGRAVAALSLQDGRVVADPFAPTADIVHLLRAQRAVATVRAGRDRRPRRLARLRPAI